MNLLFVFWQEDVELPPVTPMNAITMLNTTSTTVVPAGVGCGVVADGAVDVVVGNRKVGDANIGDIVGCISGASVPFIGLSPSFKELLINIVVSLSFLA